MIKKYKLFDMIKTMQDWITEFPYLWGKDFLKYGFEEVVEEEINATIDLIINQGNGRKEFRETILLPFKKEITTQSVLQVRRILKKSIESALNDTVVEDNAFWTDDMIAYYGVRCKDNYITPKSFKQSKQSDTGKEPERGWTINAAEQSSPIPTNNEWEIVSFKRGVDEILTLKDGKYKSSVSSISDMDFLLRNCHIVSVLRISDGVVFSVGDKIGWGIHDSFESTLTGFEIQDGRLKFYDEKLPGDTRPCDFLNALRLHKKASTTPTQPIVEDKKYTQEQMDKAIEDAFSNGRSRTYFNDSIPTYVYKFPSIKDYINHLKQNK